MALILLLIVTNPIYFMCLVFKAGWTRGLKLQGERLLYSLAALESNSVWKYQAWNWKKLIEDFILKIREKLTGVKTFETFPQLFAQMLTEHLRIYIEMGIHRGRRS